MRMIILDTGVLAALVFIFARYNAEGGFVRSFFMLLGVVAITLLIAISLPPQWLIMILPIFLILLAAGLTFVCGTQPRQTAKILGVFLIYRLAMWGIPALLLSAN